MTSGNRARRFIPPGAISFSAYAFATLLVAASLAVAQEPSWLDKRYTNLESKSPNELRFLRNEIYARHGRIFAARDLREFFSHQEWYKPDPNFKESSLTKKEKKMVAKLAAIGPPDKDSIDPAKLVGPKKSAFAALTAFYDALNQKRYADALEMLAPGAGTNRLAEWNTPDGNSDLVLGLKNGCEHGGLQCDLKISRIYSANEFGTSVEFSVEFTKNGKVFVACADATEEEGPAETHFPRTVKNFDGRFMMMELPVYCQ